MEHKKQGKFRLIMTLVSLAAFCFASFVASAKPLPPISMAQMYSFASRGNVSALRYSIDRGLDIDVQDRYGNTGLCHAILKEDYTAYNSFRASGANPRHPCTQRISPKLYYAFMNSGKVVPIDAVPLQAYDDEFYLTPMEWTLVGLAAGGIIALLLMSGGGGKSGVPISWPEPEYDSLGDAVGTMAPEEPIGYQTQIRKKIEDENVTLEENFTLDNNSKVQIKAADITDPNITRGKLTDLINMNESALRYTDYIEVAIKAYIQSNVKFGVSNNPPQDDVEIKLGNASAGMAAVEESTVTNYDKITIQAQNGTFGLIASDSSNAINEGSIDMKMIPGQGNSDNVNNQINGIYADTKATAENKGDILGITNISGTLVGMQARIVKEEKTPNPADSVKLINNGNIDLGATADNKTLNANVIGMGGFYEKSFMDGKDRYKRAGYMDITNNSVINVTLGYVLEGGYTNNVLDGKAGIIGMLSDARTTATNNGDINVKFVTDGLGVSTTDPKNALTGMLSTHGGTTVNNGTILVEGGEESFGMVGVRGAGNNPEIPNTTPKMYNGTTGSIIVDSLNGYGIATFFGGKIFNDGSITLREVGKGMFADKGELTNNGVVHLLLSGTGLEVETTGKVANSATGIIQIDQANSANGMKIKSGDAVNDGMILINNHLGDSNGISIEDGTVVNAGTILITGGTASFGVNSIAASVTNTGTINLKENGTGVYAKTGYVDNFGTIKLENGGKGIETDTGVVRNSSSVILTNGGTGVISATGELYNNIGATIDVTGDSGIGMKDGSRIQNSGTINMKGIEVKGIDNKAGNIASNNGTINIEASDTLDTSYAMYTEGDGTDTDYATHLMNKGTINMTKGGTAVYAKSGTGTNYAGSTINFTNRYGVGMKTEVGHIINDGTITGPEGMTGMHVIGAGKATNNGSINITAEPLGSQQTIGMKAENGGKIINNGTINITATITKLPQTIGMYATGAGSKVENTGSIIINGSDVSNPVNWGYCNATGCVDTLLNYRWIVVDGGAKFSTQGYVSLFMAPLNFNLMSNFGSGMIEIGQGGTFEAETIEGTVYAGSSIVGDGFEDTYVNENSFIGEDVGIDLQSGSVMFDSKLVSNGNGGYDIVAEMKSYSEVMGDSEVSAFLDTNRDMKLNGQMFTLFNSSNNLQVLGANVIDQLGLDLIPNFAKQNLDVLKSVNRQITDSLFDTKIKSDTRVMTGYDYYNRDQNGTKVFTGYEDDAHSVFVMADKKYDDTFRYGLGLGLSYLQSDYDNHDDRKEVMVQLFAPLTTRFDETLALVTTPRVGAGFGDYNRHADGLDYKADTTNYYYGVTNELRKEIDVGLVTLEPTAEFNILGVYQDDMSEKNGLEVKLSNNLSVESGLGLYAAKEFMLSEEDALKFRVGGTYYHEFNNSYQGSKAQMSGMSGSFHMESYDTQRDRGVLALQASWRHQMMNFYLQLSQYLESESATQVDAGIRVNLDDL